MHLIAGPLYGHIRFLARPQIKHDYPLNLSILIGGGKETNKDSLSSGERTGISPKPNPAAQAVGKCGFWFSAYGVVQVFKVHVIVASIPERV